MFHYALVYMAYFFSRWLPRNQRSKFQIINVVFVMLVNIPQVYVLTRLRSSRYCRQPLLSNLSASIVLSFVAIVIFTLMDPVPQGFRAAYHLFGLVSFGQGQVYHNHDSYSSNMRKNHSRVVLPVLDFVVRLHSQYSICLGEGRTLGNSETSLCLV